MTFTTLNVLPFTRQSQIKRNILVYKRVNTNVNTPKYTLLCRNSDIHERETCYSNADLMCPRFTRKTERGRTFTVRFSIEWNSTDMDIRKRNEWLALSTIYTSQISGPLLTIFQWGAISKKGPS